MRRSFQPRHALVTGAAGAIGGALVRALAARHPALRFTLVDRDTPGLLGLCQALPGRSAGLTWDISAATLPALWQEATGRSGAVDLLVSCAGIMEIRSFAATSWELGERLLNIDLVTPLRLMHLAVEGMAPGGGWIVNVSSMAGRVPIRGCSFYGAAKAGLALASQIAGLELAARGVHVLMVLPGPVRSGLEARARAQVRPGILSRHIPTGCPVELAAQIEEALILGRARLVYPGIYRIADRFAGVSGRITAALSPEPNDHP